MGTERLAVTDEHASSAGKMRKLKEGGFTSDAPKGAACRNLSEKDE
jgi:hypothetical protein